MREHDARAQRRDLASLGISVPPKCPAAVIDLLALAVASMGKAAGREHAMFWYMYLYLPLLFSAAIITAGYVIAWVLNGGGIDPGPPNARV